MTTKAFAWAFVALAAACATGDAATEPVWGKQPCAHCAMVLSDRRNGAELLTQGGDRLFFDDIGCMVTFLEERREEPRRMWAHDADTGAWLDAKAARYAPSAAATPMDYGFEAQESGGIGWDEMRAAVLARPRRES